jgi:hypothetical protein
VTRFTQCHPCHLPQTTRYWGPCGAIAAAEKLLGGPEERQRLLYGGSLQVAAAWLGGLLVACLLACLTPRCLCCCVCVLAVIKFCSRGCDWHYRSGMHKKTKHTLACVRQVDMAGMLTWLRDLGRHPVISPGEAALAVMRAPEALAVLRAKEALQARSCLKRQACSGSRGVPGWLCARERECEADISCQVSAYGASHLYGQSAQCGS